jgi:uncharacterized OB-fold protein
MSLVCVLLLSGAALFLVPLIGKAGGNVDGEGVNKNNLLWSGAGALASGLLFLEMSSVGSITIDYEWGEFLAESPLFYYVLKFGGWVIFALGVGMLVKVLLMAIEQGGKGGDTEEHKPTEAAPKVEKKPERTPVDTQPQTAWKKVRDESGNENSAICPKCGTVQRSDRSCCYNCGTKMKLE